MFTGIIESAGTVRSIETNGANKSFFIESPISDELKVDQSVSHNGVCLTVEEVENGVHKVTAIDETLKKSNLGNLDEGEIVNLERCMQMNGRLDGHIVQGHVDGTAICKSIKEMGGSWLFTFEFRPEFAHLLIEKGSVAVNGISLTVFNVTGNSFSVAIIPYTFLHTNMKTLQEGDTVNLEFDVIGKYIERIMSLRSAQL